MSDRRQINWTAEKDSIIFLYDKGYSQFDISKMYHVAQSTIGNQMLKLGIDTMKRFKPVCNDCSAPITSGHSRCIPCHSIKREDKRKGKAKPFLTKWQKRIQAVLSYAAPDYYGEVRNEEVIL